MKPFHADSKAFKAVVLDNEKPVLVDFWAEWCGPCRMLSPTIDKLAEQFDGKISVVKVNTDEAGDVAEQYNVNTIPTVFLFIGGKPVDKIVGVQPLDAFVRLIEKNLSPS